MSSLGEYLILIKKEKNEWVLSNEHTTSIISEIFEDKFIEFFLILIIRGEYMEKNTLKELRKYIFIYFSLAICAGAISVDIIKKLKNLFYLDKSGMTKTMRIFDTKKFGHLVALMDISGNTIYKESTCFD